MSTPDYTNAEDEILSRVQAPSGSTDEFLEDCIQYAALLLGGYWQADGNGERFADARKWRNQMENRYSSVEMLWVQDTLGYGYELGDEEEANP